MEIYWELKMSDGEIVNISRMVNGKNIKFSKNFLNRNTKKLNSLVLVVYAVFGLLGIFSATGKNAYPGLVGINR